MNNLSITFTTIRLTILSLTVIFLWIGYFIKRSNLKDGLKENVVDKETISSQYISLIRTKLKNLTTKFQGRYEKR